MLKININVLKYEKRYTTTRLIGAQNFLEGHNFAIFGIFLIFGFLVGPPDFSKCRAVLIVPNRTNRVSEDLGRCRGCGARRTWAVGVVKWLLEAPQTPFWSILDRTGTFKKCQNFRIFGRSAGFF